MDDLTIRLVKTASQFDVHRWSDHPEVNHVVSRLFDEVVALRRSRNTKARIRDAAKIRRAIKVIVLDLYVAATMSDNPFRSISKNKTDYRSGSRYRKIFLKYDILIPSLDDLSELGYVHQEIGYHKPTGDGRYTRIKATKKLIDLILEPEHGVGELIQAKGLAALVMPNPNPEERPELIRLNVKDEDGDKSCIEYEDTNVTIEMRNRLERINTKLAKAKIALAISDSQHRELIKHLGKRRSQGDCRVLNFTRVALHRVFNNARTEFDHGGRFYGGWWQSVPRSFRKYITIDGRSTVELDYSGHHIRMLYAEAGLLTPDDPYDLPDFIREHQKEALLIILNAKSDESAIGAMKNKGIKNCNELLQALKTKHKPIADKFHSGLGWSLQYQDSKIAEDIMLHLIERDICVLPIHDSFIVARDDIEELDLVMQWSFESRYSSLSKVKHKAIAPTVIGHKRWPYSHLDYKELGSHLNGYTKPKDTSASYNWYESIWGKW
jgi:hypothetical protein